MARVTAPGVTEVRLTNLDEITDAGLIALSAALGSSTAITTVVLEGIDITDAGLKDFSAALGSSSTITTVALSHLYNVTDTGLKAFSAAVGSSTTITTVTLGDLPLCSGDLLSAVMNLIK